MLNKVSPQIGSWYHCSELPEIFEIVATDDQSHEIEIQYFSGDIQEVDQAEWQVYHLVEIPPPEDYSGACSISREDIYQDIIYPEDYSPLDNFESNDFDWHTNYTR